MGWSAAYCALILGCGSTAPASSAQPPAGIDAGQADVGASPQVRATRHVLLRAGAPAQFEPSIAINGGVLATALRAGTPDANERHLRFGVAPIGSDRTAGAFALRDLSEPAYAPHIEPAGTSGFHVFWLTALNGGLLRYMAIDLQGQPLGQPMALGAADDFAVTVSASGGPVAFATRVVGSLGADEIDIGILPSSSTSLALSVPVESCAHASKPALTWTGQALDLYYGCATADGAQNLRHARLDGSGALLATPATILPGAVDPLVSPAQPAVLYWYASAWMKGPIDPATGAVTSAGPAGFAVGAARGVARAREATWGLSVACQMGEDLAPFGGFTACAWDGQGLAIAPCVALSVSPCASAAIAGDGDAAFVAFDAGDNAWLLPIGALPVDGTHLYPSLIGRARTVKPRPLRCDASLRCAVVVDEPVVDLAVTTGPQVIYSPTAWTDDPWPSGESTSLAFYTVDAGASPSVAVVRSAERFPTGPALADRLSPAGIGLVRDATFSLLGPDGTVAWQVALPGSGFPYRAFDEGGQFRVFQALSSNGLVESVVGPDGLRSTRTLTSNPSWIPQGNTPFSACGGAYLAGDASAGGILRYDPASASGFAVWQRVYALDAFGCGPAVMATLSTLGGLGGATTTLSRWAADGTILPATMFSPSIGPPLGFVPDTLGFSWFASGGFGGNAGADGLDVVTVNPSSVTRGRLPVPSSVQDVVSWHGDAVAGALSAAYCDQRSGDCWLSNWSE
jgi:hypothetical protein